MSLRLHRARALVPFVAVCLTCVSTGCGSTVASSTAPSLAKCGVTLTAPAASIDPAGAPATIAVNTQPECTWSATSEASWITGLTPASGQGTGEIKIDVAANPAISSRQGDVVVNGVRAQIRQEAATCRFDVSSSSQTFDETGGTARISVTTLAGCAWTARADAPWVTVTSGSAGTGPGAVTISVAANTGDARSASLAIADRTVRISQDAKPVLVPPTTSCVFDVTPTSASVGAAGGGGTTITVDTGAGCEWTAASNAGWLTITSDTHSFGSGSVTFNAAVNTGSARSGTLSIAGQTVTVSQAAASSTTCSYTVTPMTLSLPSSGSTSSSFTVTSSSGCAWTASENVSWMTITSGTSGSGNGTVKISVDANATSSVRTGTLTIAGHQVTITEAGLSCTYTVSPTTVSIGATGGTGTPIGVTAAAGCTWTAASGVSWITLLTGQTGTGNGVVTYTVLANTGPARSGTLTVAGQTVTISQNSGCTYTINPTSQAFPTEGGTGGPVTVTTQSGCAWTAASNVSWITITSGATRTGTGTVTFTVAANTGGARTGTLTIAGSTFTVTQAKK